jgi:curli biogenesis system outer membrane secretion channel CsgG
MRRSPFAIALLCCALPALAAQNPKRRVAVLPFDYASVQPSVIEIFGADVDLGESVADLVAESLVRNGAYSVLDRSQMDAAMRDQGLQQSSRTDAATAAKIAKALGVNAIIIGKITQLSHAEKDMQVATGMRVGGISLSNVGTKTSTATVTVDVRLVNAANGDILAVAANTASSSGSGVSATGNSNSGASQIDLGSSSYAGSAVAKALQSAAAKLASDLAAAAGKLLAAKAAIQGLVADVSGKDVIINVGTDAGVVVGADYNVVRPGRVVKDPASGRVLRVTTTPVGKLKITQADSVSSSGTMSSGAPKVGDCVGACPTP